MKCIENERVIVIKHDHNVRIFLDFFNLISSCVGFLSEDCWKDLYLLRKKLKKNF